MTKENEIVLFETEDKRILLPGEVKDETVWLNRNQMAELFDRDVKTIGKHVNNALKEELRDEDSVVAFFATTASDGSGVLQPRRHHLRRLPCKIQSWCRIS